MSDKIRWGILSTANIGRKVIPAMQNSHNGEVVAVASRNIDRAKAYAEELNIPTAYGSYEELLNDPNIDAIYNPLPNSQHAEWSIAAAEAGKPTLCEKPFASDALEAQKMVDAFAERDILFAEAFMYRFHPQTQRVKQMLDDGAIGELTIMNSSFSFFLSNAANIRLSKALAGGAVMDVGCYCINVMRLMTGEAPTQGHAIAQFGEESGVDEVFTAVLEFPSGIVGHLDCSLRAARLHTYELRGSTGRIVVPQGFTMPKDQATTIIYENGDDREEITIPPADSYQLMAEDFADALLNNRPPTYAPQDGVTNMEVIDMLLASARS